MSRRSELWKTAFYLLVLVYGLVILLTFQEYGFTTDEQFHMPYGEALVKWYTSGFQNQDVFAFKHTWLYGGLFNLSAALIAHILPLETYDSRHLCNAFVGLLGIVAAYKIGELLGGSPTGFLSALFLLLIPRYYGHAFNNPKDIPFAVCYLWSLFYLIRTLRAFPDLNKNLIWKTGLTIGLALAVRVSGYVLIACFSLFLFLKWIQEGRPNPVQTAQRAFFILSIAYLTMILFWPLAQVHPLSGPWEAIHTFSTFPEIHNHLFDGRYVGSNETSRFYALQWILLTLPEFVFLGLVAWLYTAFRKPDFDWTGQGLLVFSVFFPLGYALLVRIPFYDGLRHVLFVLPPVAILSAVGTVDLYRRIHSETMRRGYCALVGFLLVLTLWEMVRLHPNEYVYFNQAVAGGLDRAARSYDTDYWKNSYRQGLKWVETNSVQTSGKIRIYSFDYFTPLISNSSSLTVVSDPEDADLYMSTTRYDQHKVFPGEIIHTVTVGETDLLYVIRPDSTYNTDPFFAQAPLRYFYIGGLYYKAGALEKAMDMYQIALKQGLQEHFTPARLEILYIYVGNTLLEQGRLSEALQVVKDAVSYKPTFAEAWYLMGQILKIEGEFEVAHQAFLKALTLKPGESKYRTAHLDLGRAYHRLKKLDKALTIYREALDLNPESLEAKEGLKALMGQAD